MKALHRPDLYCWSVFNERMDIDFNSFLWVREGGNVAIDPPPLSAHDREHVRRLGGVRWIVLTTSDHVRGAEVLADELGASLAGPAGERAAFPLQCDRWLGDGDELVPGLMAIEMRGSKTPGELALLLEGTTLITGDLVRAQRAGSLNLLAPEKLADRRQVVGSVRRLLEHENVEAVLVGDGWSVFRDGRGRLEELLDAVG
jgi:glyoxylase-like metal-dependent hydrolase (beta-lactamase superfamily II)